MRALDYVLQEMKTPVVYLNISRLTDYRKDGHPSIYRMKYKTVEEQKNEIAKLKNTFEEYKKSKDESKIIGSIELLFSLDDANFLIAGTKNDILSKLNGLLLYE